MANEFFIQRPAITPTIYVYELIGVASHKGYIKIGYTERDAATRIKEQLHTAAVPFKILYQESAMRAIIECQPYKLPAAYFDEWKYFLPAFQELS